MTAGGVSPQARRCTHANTNQQVRVAAIKSIARLALGSRVFRDKAGDVLVDMLSDEILLVRMAAIEALDGLRRHIELSEEHLQVRGTRLRCRIGRWPRYMERVPTRD